MRAAQLSGQDGGCGLTIALPIAPAAAGLAHPLRASQHWLRLAAARLRANWLTTSGRWWLIAPRMTAAVARAGAGLRPRRPFPCIVRRKPVFATTSGVLGASGWDPRASYANRNDSRLVQHLFQRYTRLVISLDPDRLLEALAPLGDARHSREVKLRACKRVVLEQWSFRAAAREAGAGHPAVTRWVCEVAERLAIAHGRSDLATQLREPAAVPA